MAYNVVYEMKPAERFLRQETKQRIRKKRMLIVFGLIVVISSACLLFDRLWLSSTSTVNLAANDMVNDILNGEQVVDAFVQFCKTVLQIR